MIMTRYDNFVQPKLGYCLVQAFDTRTILPRYFQTMLNLTKPGIAAMAMCMCMGFGPVRAAWERRMR